MNRKGLGYIPVFIEIVCLILLTGCGHDQQLASISVQPSTENFGSTNIPVSANAGASVQLRALGTYIHPPVTKDITTQVTWTSNTPEMVTVSSTGLLTATGLACGSALVSATITTNKSTGNLSSSGAIVTGNMTANVICSTATGPTPAVNVAMLVARP
jgi:Bacterial Ig-like domain (group 2)